MWLKSENGRAVYKRGEDRDGIVNAFTSRVVDNRFKCLTVTSFDQGYLVSPNDDIGESFQKSKVECDVTK